MRNRNRLDAADLPQIPDHVTSADLPPWMRAQLRSLGDQNGELVARHLAMVLEYLEQAPELAYRHARAAADRAGRIALVREYAGLTSYYAERYAEAVRELRTYQRLSGERHHTALLADALRGIEKPEEALEVAATTRLGEIDQDEAVELVIVTAGARADLGEYGAALVALDRFARGAEGVGELDPEQRDRLRRARARIEALAAGGSPEDEEFEVDDADPTDSWLPAALLAAQAAQAAQVAQADGVGGPVAQADGVGGPVAQAGQVAQADGIGGGTAAQADGVGGPAAQVARADGVGGPTANDPAAGEPTEEAPRW
jgi:hypothetical protein